MVQHRGMAREIQERIKKLIVDQRLPSGAPLPTENELMERLGVSRNSVREALKALQAMGIVEIRHGFGTYVGAMSMAPMIEGLTFRTVAGHYRGEDSLLQLLELREAIEAGLIARLVDSVGGPGRRPSGKGAAERGISGADAPAEGGTGEDAEGGTGSATASAPGSASGARHPVGDGDFGTGELETLVARMRREAESGGVRAETDRAFHMALYRGLGNSLLSEVLDAFWDAFHRVRTDLADTRQDPRDTWSQHAEILAAVRAGDTLRAESAVRDHFGDLRARLRSTTPPQPPA